MMNNNGESDCNHQGEESGTVGVVVSMDERDSNLTGDGKEVEIEQDTDTDETGLPEDSKVSVAEDEALAVWVKWRGKWQAGIKCARADWPLPTLKAKPTHDRKEYIVIFFPRKKHYSWADVLLVRPIDQFPEPIAHRTHKVGLKIVKDLTVARRFIMQKLARNMLDIIDELHMKAFIESARSVTVWREFGMEAARCKDYSHLGRMLVKLQSMIVQSCVSSDWITASFESWVQQCQDACTAESVEMLKEELMSSIRWGEVNSLSDVAEQSELGMEWKVLKQEVIRIFSASNPDAESKISESPRPRPVDVDVDLLQACRKRPKLEVRRAEAHPPQAAENVNTIEIDAGFFYDRGQEKWAEIVVQPDSSEAKANETTVASSSNSSKNRRCIAFIEAKGRQCVRWANDGDVYCCVHLTSRFSIGTPQEKPSPIDSPMCDGTTIHGNKCKHRALQGTTSCKKHRPRKGIEMALIPLDNNIHVTRNHEVPATPISVMISESREITTTPPPFSVISVERSVDVPRQRSSDEASRCLGGFSPEGNHLCLHDPKRYLLYCEDHLPSWLKRARNGKSRIVSKEVFVELLNDCSTREQKLHLHQACELFYRLFKSILSMRNPVPEEVQLQWAITEASKDSNVGSWLTKLVSCEIETLRRLWGFDSDKEKQVEESTRNNIVCKICSMNFLDDKEIGTHWMACHKKEAKSLFKGYMCAICLDSYKNKNVLETHFKERHHTQFFESCMLFQCIPCGGNFGSTEQLWAHVLSVHPSLFKLSGSSPLPEIDQESLPNSISQDNRRFTCKYCSMRFDLLPDLGRHHRAVHKGTTSAAVDSRPTKRAYKLKTNKIRRPRFKKVLRGPYRIRNRGTATGITRRIQLSNSNGTVETNVQNRVNEATMLISSDDTQFLDVLNILLSKIQSTSPRPTNNDLLAMCRSACCKVWLQNILEQRYGGLLPKRLYLKAVKLCSEQNIAVRWHIDGYVCPRGCIPVLDQQVGNEETRSRSVVRVDCSANNDWERDESHYVIDLKDLKPNPMRRTFMLCSDISFGQETVPVICIADENLLPAVCVYGGKGSLDPSFMPWESFNYGRKSLIDPSVCLEEPTSFQLGCHCKESTCSPSVCDHVYLFDNDYEDAKDVNGKSMVGRFPYDENGRIILAEGYLVYECNQRCGCNSSCKNRVLQNGVKANLEVFRTEKKGWGVRAGEPIMKGTFICECVGRIIKHMKPSENCERIDDWGYIQEIDDQVDYISRLMEEDQTPYMIDSKNYGNVSRFINHSCSPNLVSYQVLVESMDSHLTHIGLYASRDIAKSEELTYDYRYKLVPGDGIPCQCEAPNCRGRLY
ncbi:histone-lysine N-methyltransferase SUVR5 [Impatiens glandulifera]|uniref:histone-lysine N-methyltransferase SUVR5 n=1 Tax=Impatiens glandulifera TaxID=253017 RepID=UPI001FB1708A|nr:histone-lysine N-methyltransferase SUVR5 [Impatiens glandulifera]